MAAPMSKTWPTPRSVIIAGVTIPRPTITLCFDDAAASLGSPGKPLSHDAPVHPDDVVRADPALPDRSLPGADVVDHRAVPPEIHDFSDLEFLIRGREDFVRHGPVSLVDRELDSDPVDPFRPDGRHLLRPRGRDAASLGLHRGDLDPRVSEVELLSHRDVLFRRELQGRALRLVEPRHDKRDLDRLRFRVTIVDTRPQFGHFTVPSKTISSLPPILPRSTRWGASAPHTSHLRTRALGAAIVLSNAGTGKRICGA